MARTKSPQPRSQRHQKAGARSVERRAPVRLLATELLLTGSSMGGGSSGGRVPFSGFRFRKEARTEVTQQGRQLASPVAEFAVRRKAGRKTNHQYSRKGAQLRGK